MRAREDSAQGAAVATSVARTDVVDDLTERITGLVRSDGATHWLHVRPETYAIADGDAFLLFSPLRGQVLRLTKAGVARLLLEPEATIGQCVAGSEGTWPESLLSSLDDPAGDNAPAPSDNERPLPVSLTLSLTSACQLACTYCYIRGGDRPRNMPWPIAEAAIRLAADNAAEAGRQVLALQFHGQGEPTASWPLFVRTVEFAEEQCRARGLRPVFAVMTNGILTRKKVGFLAAHRFSVGLSLDGLQPAQDAQRPMRGTGGSFARVMATCRLFAESGLDFGIRSTVTPRTVAEMPAFVQFVGSHTTCRSVDFEPVTNAGRACDGGFWRASSTSGFLEDFAREFEMAREVGLECGAQVSYAPCRVGPAHSAFCGAVGKELSFCVSTDGLVSSCYEVLDADDPRASVFAYGAFDAVAGAFRIDAERLSALRSLDVTKMARCSGCFARWSCAGGCLADVAYGGVEAIAGPEPLPRCRPTRGITRSALALLVTKQEVRT